MFWSKNNQQQIDSEHKEVKDKWRTWRGGFWREETGNLAGSHFSPWGKNLVYRSRGVGQEVFSLNITHSAFERCVMYKQSNSGFVANHNWRHCNRLCFLQPASHVCSQRMICTYKAVQVSPMLFLYYQGEITFYMIPSFDFVISIISQAQSMDDPRVRCMPVEQESTPNPGRTFNYCKPCSHVFQMKWFQWLIFPFSKLLVFFSE